MRKSSIDSIKKIEEYKSLGFARASTLLINYFRRINDPNVKIFRPGSHVRGGKGSIRYTSRDIFGYSHFSHIYDIRYSENFVNYLVTVFLSENPEPNISIRKAFTRVLHNNGLHWEYCQHTKKRRRVSDTGKP